MAKLEYLMTYRADLKPAVAVGAVPSGSRQIFDVTGGTFQGPRLKGKLHASGADWLLVGNDGVGRLDVRGTLETDEGALIYLQYHGVLQMNEAFVSAISAGGETGFGDVYFMTQPRFETGAESYAWLNSVVAVGEGRILPGAVEYRVYEVVND